MTPPTTLPRLLLFVAFGALAAQAEAPGPAPLHRVTFSEVMVRVAPDWKAGRRGMVSDCAVVEVLEEQSGPGCKASWARIGVEAWLCLDYTNPTEEPLPTSHPLVAFDHPTPEERAGYRATGAYDRAVGAEAEALLPYVYGRRLGSFEGRCYADVESARSGAAPVARVDASRRQAYVEVVETEDGGFLRRPDGTVVPVGDVFLYAPSRFRGVDLTEDPGPADTLPAWVRQGGGRLRAEESVQSAVLDDLDARSLLRVGAPVPAPDGRGWCRVWEVEGAPRQGFIADSRLRRVRPLAPPREVGAAEVWLDVDLDQQVLTMWAGTTLRYATLVSTGVSNHRTPVGLYRIQDKMLHWDMASRSDSAAPYHIEEVPWVMHFWPRYALHTAFWHDGFGEPQSHGCVNLAPKDARFLFEETAPQLPPGWHSVWESEGEPGALMRVRVGAEALPDRRSALR